MAQTLERLIRRANTMQSIRGIVRTMKTMSAINAAPYEQAARAIDGWRDTVLLGLHGFLRLNGRLVQDHAPAQDLVIIAMGSDHGLCGNYNEVLAEQVAGRITQQQMPEILCVGAQMADALEGKGIVPAATLLPPANVDGLNRLADELVTWLEVMQTQAAPRDVGVTLVYTMRGSHGKQGPVSQALLPLDAALLEDLATRPWVSRSLPQSGLPAPRMLAALVRNLLFATLYRAAAEALVTENAARLARMQQAEQSVDEKREDLHAQMRSVRQSEITTELMDVIVGFEALKARDKRKTGPRKANPS